MSPGSPPLAAAQGGLQLTGFTFQHVAACHSSILRGSGSGKLRERIGVATNTEDVRWLDEHQPGWRTATPVTIKRYAAEQLQYRSDPPGAVRHRPCSQSLVRHSRWVFAVPGVR